MDYLGSYRSPRSGFSYITTSSIPRRKPRRPVSTGPAIHNSDYYNKRNIWASTSNADNGAYEDYYLNNSSFGFRPRQHKTDVERIRTIDDVYRGLNRFKAPTLSPTRSPRSRYGSYRSTYDGPSAYPPLYSNTPRGHSSYSGYKPAMDLIDTLYHMGDNDRNRRLYSSPQPEYSRPNLMNKINTGTLGRYPYLYPRRSRMGSDYLPSVTSYPTTSPHEYRYLRPMPTWFNEPLTSADSTVRNPVTYVPPQYVSPSYNRRARSASPGARSALQDRFSTYSPFGYQYPYPLPRSRSSSRDRFRPTSPYTSPSPRDVSHNIRARSLLRTPADYPANDIYRTPTARGAPTSYPSPSRDYEPSPRTTRANVDRSPIDDEPEPSRRPSRKPKSPSPPPAKAEPREPSPPPKQATPPLEPASAAEPEPEEEPEPEVTTEPEEQAEPEPEPEAETEPEEPEAQIEPEPEPEEEAEPEPEEEAEPEAEDEPEPEQEPEEEAEPEPEAVDEAEPEAEPEEDASPAEEEPAEEEPEEPEAPEVDEEPQDEAPADEEEPIDLQPSEPAEDDQPQDDDEVPAEEEEADPEALEPEEPQPDASDDPDANNALSKVPDENDPDTTITTQVNDDGSITEIQQHISTEEYEYSVVTEKRTTKVTETYEETVEEYEEEVVEQEEEEEEEQDA